MRSIICKKNRTKATAMTSDRLIFRQDVIGSRRFSNYWWATVSTIGGIGFFLAGLSSYLHTNLLIVSDTSSLQFIPQGVALLFYGIAGSLLASYQWLMIILNVGGGYNEFNKQTNQVKIFRWGFPGKNRRVEFTCPLEDVQAVKAEIQEGLNTKRKLYLKVKQKRDVPLTRVGQPMSLSELENEGAELASFMGVPLEGL
uniref:photosystem I assembly protein Ycf4 n=2 Tax=Cyanothece sp. BG0011 TaxID=2082950 RepID=UPI0030DAC73E